MVLTRNDEVLLTQRAADAKWGANLWHLPGGMVEEGESTADAAVRETREEIDVDVSPDDMMFQAAVTYDQANGDKHDLIYFSTSTWSGEPRIAEPDKCQAMQWRKLSDLPENLTSHARAVLSDISKPTYVHVYNGEVKYQR